MTKFWNKIKENSAGAMVENVIVLPLVFVVIIFMLVSGFLIHDRTTIEAAARRGVTYAAHCISDPSYASLLGQSGELDYKFDPKSLDFKGVGKNIDAYRYLTGGSSVQGVVETEVKKIIDKTRINWLDQDNVKVTCNKDNKVIYQDITVDVEATYHLPGWFGLFGLETEYVIETEAKLAAVDPDEFIRNADLVVDLMTDIDEATGGNAKKAIEKIKGIASKLLDWINMA